MTRLHKEKIDARRRQRYMGKSFQTMLRTMKTMGDETPDNWTAWNMGVLFARVQDLERKIRWLNKKLKGKA